MKDRKKEPGFRAQELCKLGGGLDSQSFSHSSPVPNNPYGCRGRKAPCLLTYLLTTSPELRNCVNREVNLGSHSLPTLHPSLINHTVSVEVNHHKRRRTQCSELINCTCEQGGGLGSCFIPFFPHPLINHTVSVNANHHKGRRTKRFSVDVKHHEG